MSILPIIEHADAEALAHAVAGQLADAIRAGVAERGDAWLALAGGSTPFAAYRLLAAMDLPWTQVHLVASDERWVPTEHERRNERALRDAFIAATGVRLHPIAPDDTLDAVNTATADAHLAPLQGRRFDAVLLGMGADAHFASLFPNVTSTAALDPGDAAIATTLTPDPLPPEAPFPRVSLTLSRLVATHRPMLMITGAAKRTILEQARTQPPAQAPIRALLEAAPGLAIHWSP